MIREIDVNDFSVITEYYREFDDNEVDLFNLDTFTKIYVYEVDKKVVGFINFSVIYDRAELNYIYIDKDYRGNNYASILLEFLINECNKKRCSNITLEVSKNNIGGIKLYKKYGFEEKAIRKNYYKGVDGILMMKELINNE